MYEPILLLLIVFRLSLVVSAQRFEQNPRNATLDDIYFNSLRSWSPQISSPTIITIDPVRNYSRSNLDQVIRNFLQQFYNNPMVTIPRNGTLQLTQRRPITRERLSTTTIGSPLNPVTSTMPPMRSHEREGKLRLVGGQTLFEGNVEINHLGRWGSICDDEWDLNEANIICRQLGFVLGAQAPTTDSKFGKGRKLIWMDNLFCTGTEKSIQDCPFDGWNIHDCTQNEAAGVVCRIRVDQESPTGEITRRNIQSESNVNSIDDDDTIDDFFVSQNEDKVLENLQLKSLYDGDVRVRLIDGLADHQGRVEIFANKRWQVVCGDGWSLNEAEVICKQLNFGFAENVLHIELENYDNLNSPIAGIKCNGNETNISDCFMAKFSSQFCTDSFSNVAGVTCGADLPDLIPDAMELEQSSFIEDRSILFLQCAMEENCLSRSAYEIDKSDPSWVYNTRRLLRFTARIKNIGKVDFVPNVSKDRWVWHSCHRHYHSMEVFAHFDIIDEAGKRVAEGHKASFCLEDNDCDPGSSKTYSCANYGDQGISVGCVDIYKYELDCQWIDITDIEPGNYFLKVTINPEFKVPELSFNNNAALCRFHYNYLAGYVTNCTNVRP